MTRKGYFNAKPPEEAVQKLRSFYNLESNIHPGLDWGLSVKGMRSSLNLHIASIEIK